MSTTNHTETPPPCGEVLYDEHGKATAYCMEVRGSEHSHGDSPNSSVLIDGEHQATVVVSGGEICQINITVPGGR